jgi:hypothetical protein
VEVAKLITEIVICLALVVIGGGLLGTVVWLTLRLKEAIEALTAICELFEKVIDNEAAVAASADEMAAAVGGFKATVSEDLKAVKEAEMALIRIVASNIVTLKGLSNVVSVFEKNLLDAIPNREKKNYDVSPEIAGLSKEQQEELEAAEVLRVQTARAPEIIAT